MMRAKRQRDRKAITSFQQGREERQEGPADTVAQKELSQKEGKEEEDMAEAVEVWAAGAARAGEEQVPTVCGTGSRAAPSPYTVCGSGTGAQFAVYRRGVWRLRQEDGWEFKASLGHRVILSQIIQEHFGGRGRWTLKFRASL